MKRSEMAKKLEDYLLENLRMRDFTDEDSGTYVLNFIEELGMQAPAIKEPCETFVLHNGKYVKVEDSFIFTNKWDAE